MTQQRCDLAHAQVQRQIVDCHMLAVHLQTRRCLSDMQPLTCIVVLIAHPSKLEGGSIAWRRVHEITLRRLVIWASVGGPEAAPPGSELAPASTSTEGLIPMSTLSPSTSTCAAQNIERGFRRFQAPVCIHNLHEHTRAKPISRKIYCILGAIHLLQRKLALYCRSSAI